MPESSSSAPIPTPGPRPPTSSAGTFFGLHGPIPLLIACLLGSLTSSSYNTMIAVALPDIGRQLGLDLTVVQWVILIYLLVNSSTIAISGRVSELVGARLIYRIGLGIFSLGGLACALAPSLPILLAMRALQALGAGMFVVSVPVILTSAFPDEQRGRVLGLYSTAVFIGISAGPLLGGVITEWVGWRGVFVGTMLLGAFALWLALLCVPLEPRRAGRAAPFDLLGSLAYMGMLAPLLLGLGRARQQGLGSPETLGLLALSTLAAAAFVTVELRTAAPMFDLRLFARRYFSLSMLSSLTVFLSYYTVVFLMPFYLVQARGISPSLSGLLLSAYPITMALVASPAGVLNDRIGPILPASIGAIGIGVSMLLFAQVGSDTPYLYIVAALALVGLGAGLGDVSNNAAMMGAAPPARRGMASGVIATTRYVGQSLGVAFSSLIFTLAAGAEVGSQSWHGFTAAFLGMSAFAWLSLVTSLTRGKAPRRPPAPSSA